MSGSTWIKIVVGLLIVVMAVAVVGVFLDNGLGDPKDLPRTPHPSGFSFVAPRGWGATVYYRPDEDYLRVSPEHTTGRGMALVVSKFKKLPTPADGAVAVTFQDQPATMATRQGNYDFNYTIDFVRDGAPFRIILRSPIAIDPLHCEITPFLNSFRTEAVREIPAVEGQVPASFPASMPAVVP